MINRVKKRSGLSFEVVEQLVSYQRVLRIPARPCHPLESGLSGRLRLELL